MKIFCNTLRLLFLNHKGTGHKLAHNITTIANIPLVAWLIYVILSVKDTGYEGFAQLITEPFHTAVAIIFTISTLLHFTLEIEVVLEDYISDISVRHLVISLMKVIWLALGVTTIISILQFGL